MRFSERMDRVPPYLFVQISRKIAEKKAQGIEVISFGIGDPDIPTPDYVIDALGEASHDAPNHRYPESEGLPEFREGVADWYLRRFGVKLDSEKEVISLIGAKEGIGHVAFCFLDAGDIALVPDPGYPVYAMGTLFAGGESYMLPLTEENAWLPDLDAIPDDVAGKAKLLWLNYPNNPTGAVRGPRLLSARQSNSPKSTISPSCMTPATPKWRMTAIAHPASLKSKGRWTLESNSTRFPSPTT